MSGDNISKQMAEFLRLLAVEVENNQAMAKRLAAPFRKIVESQDLTTAKAKAKKNKDKALIPEGFDPFKIYYDKGSVGLHNELAGLDVQTLKAILAYFALDPARSYIRWRKHERLEEFIIERVRAMSSKGQAFME